MNAFVKTAALSCALMAATSSAPGQDVDPFADAPEDAKAHLPKLIRVQVEWIEMDHGTLTDLMREHRSDSDDGDLRDECERLVRKGDAEILETAMTHFQLTAEQLQMHKRGDLTRAAIATRLFKETTVSQSWIAKRLGIKSAPAVCQQIRRYQLIPTQKLPPKIRKWRNVQCF